MDGIEHIVTAVSAPWSGWLMLGLMLCAILSEWFQPGIISQAHSSLSVRNDRVYKESPATFFGQMLLTIFRIGTVSMALCLCWAPEDRFSLGAFAIVSALVLVVLAVKMLCHWLVDYTFMLSRRFGTPYEHYGNLFTLTTLLLYPVVLILNHVASPLAAQWCLGGIAILFGLLWLYRCIRTYIQSVRAVIYLIIYFCTLELLPFVGLAYVAAKTIIIL